MEHNSAKTHSTLQKHINSVKKKWLKDIDNIKLLKYETKQLHHLMDKMLADGRLTMDELRTNVHSRKEAKQILSKNGKK